MVDYVTGTPGMLDFANGLIRAMDDKYSAYILFDKNDPAQAEEFRTITRKVMETIKEGTTREGRDANGAKTAPPFAGRNPDDPAFVKMLHMPFGDGDTAVFASGEHAGQPRSEVNKEFAGHWFVKVSTRTNLLEEGRIIDPHRTPVKASDLYAGNMVRVRLWLQAYKADRGGMGVTARLVSMVVTDPGAPLFDRADSDPFAGFDLPDENGANDPFSGMGV